MNVISDRYKPILAPYEDSNQLLISIVADSFIKSETVEDAIKNAEKFSFMVEDLKKFSKDRYNSNETYLPKEYLNQLCNFVMQTPRAFDMSDIPSDTSMSSEQLIEKYNAAMLAMRLFKSAVENLLEFSYDFK